MSAGFGLSMRHRFFLLGRVGLTRKARHCTPHGVRQAASPSQSPGRRGRGRSPYSEEDVHSQASLFSFQGTIRDPSFEESGGSLESDDSFSSPHRSSERRHHRDGWGSQSHGLHPHSNTDLFGGNLSKAVAMVASVSHNYKALVNSFVLSGLPRSRPPRGGK